MDMGATSWPRIAEFAARRLLPHPPILSISNKSTIYWVIVT